MVKHFPVIETKRLILREVTIEDANDMFNYLSDKDVVKHTGLKPSKTVEDVWGKLDGINLYTKKEQALDGELQ